MRQDLVERASGVEREVDPDPAALWPVVVNGDASRVQPGQGAEEIRRVGIVEQGGPIVVADHADARGPAACLAASRPNTASPR